MRKNFEENFIIDEGFEELVERIIRAQDDIEIESLLESDQEEEIDIYKQEVHPIHLLDDLKELYDRHEVQYYQNSYGNIVAYGEDPCGNPYEFYVYWEQCQTIRFFIGSGDSFITPFGSWTWSSVPIAEMIAYQNRRRMLRKRKHYENEDENND